VARDVQGPPPVLRPPGSPVLIAFVLALAASPARAEDRWSEPHPGIRLLERTVASPSNRVFALLADLRRPDIRITATRREHRGRTVSSFAASYACAAAVNGDFFGSDFATTGLAMGGGAHWPGSSDGPTWSFVAAGVDNRVEISLPEVVGSIEPWMTEVVGGYPLLVDEGVARSFGSCDTSFCRRNPRTAVGHSRDGDTLFLVVVDGRSTTSVGMSLPETAALLVDLGAWRALNLDGGGSSALFLDSRGIVNRPSDGAERRVANHLGITFVHPDADAGPIPATPDAAVPDTPDAHAGDAATAAIDADVGGGCSAGPSPRPAGGLPLFIPALLLYVVSRRAAGKKPARARK
jgi:hypothetical protein